MTIPFDYLNNKMNLKRYFREKTLSYSLVGGLILGMFVGCKVIKKEISNVLHEDAQVVQTIF